MRFLNSLFGSRAPKQSVLRIDPRHGKQPVDPFYVNFDIEKIAAYQRHFERIVAKVDVENYTKWSQSAAYNRQGLDADDEWTHEYVKQAEQQDCISGDVLLTIVNQFYFADWLAREMDRGEWVKRVLYRQPTDYFPDANRLRMVLSLVME
jgi:hypothetical protein